MYSGYILVYGFSIYPGRITEMFDLDENLDDDVYELIEEVNKILIKQGIKLVQLHAKHCCSYEKGDNVYLGVELGRNLVQYRSNVEEFLSFDTYHEEYLNQLKEIKNFHKRNKSEMNKAFKQLVKLYPLLKEEQLKYIKYANDCGSCT